MNYKHENKIWFEVLKGVKIEDEVKYKGKEGTLKKFFAKDRGKTAQNIYRDGNRKKNMQNDVLLIMHKDCEDKGCDWVRENFGVTFKFK